ncbi:sodium-dependent bicarbonate transport family permease [Catenovulum sp. SM1970]|uniref:sodium-dependent bicarbonate transport family permease n=1 Tax=Marinifaba aquimaris TaxID=2741323 RepID=UPI0015748B11|nr:sodium-dependent bicarbonate transport family permease [Marinifaba aquimaris]NTS76107.1 sodium-dependent bicarbonate transport family permease [Marinifaba aquimaris]
MASFLPDILALFFLMALVCQRLGVNLQLPNDAYQLLTYVLLITIGLKGGQALAYSANWALLGQSISVIMLGVLVTLVAMLLIGTFSKLNTIDKTTLAAHYGSVSVGTYAVAISFLQLREIEFEPQIALFVALLELPAIIFGLAYLSRKQGQKGFDLRTIFAHKSLALIVIGMLIGALYGEVAEPMVKNLKPIFAVMLALYLIHMGALAGQRLSDLSSNHMFIISFGITMPVLGAIMGLTLGYWLGLSVGGLTLLATLAASASYIAVPAVFEQAQPKANIAQALVASLAITFSFNVIWGIPLYAHAADIISRL